MNAHDFEAIAALDLEPIKVKLMHRESGEGWSLEQANAVEFEYRRFLYLMKRFPQEAAAPLQDVDTFWHYHILDTMKYAADCEAVFGYFLHHFPYIGLRGEEDLEAHQRVGQRMKELYEATFEQPYGLGAAAYSARTAETAYSARTVQTAYSARAPETAYSARAPQTAYSARAPQSTAYSARAPEATAYSARSPQATLDGGSATPPGFFSDRPRL